MSEYKTKIPRVMIDIVVALIIASYGYIFYATTDRIEVVENKLEAINPVLLQIQTDLAEIRTDVKWIINK